MKIQNKQNTKVNDGIITIIIDNNSNLYGTVYESPDIGNMCLSQYKLRYTQREKSSAHHYPLTFDKKL